MRLKTFSIVSGLILATILFTACSAIARHHHALVAGDQQGRSAPAPDDPITGEWNVSFFVHDEKTPASYTLKLEGTKITGTVYSDHTGPGTIREGKWENGKLSFTLDFQKHQSIAVTGALKDGKLLGEFSTEGFTDKWEAVRK